MANEMCQNCYFVSDQNITLLKFINLDLILGSFHSTCIVNTLGTQQCVRPSSGFIFWVSPWGRFLTCEQEKKKIYYKNKGFFFEELFERTQPTATEIYTINV